jgi:hypothetical protein
LTRACSISSLLPRRSSPAPADDASTRKRRPCGFTAPAVPAPGLASDFRGMASSRYAGVSPSPSFGPSRFAPLLWPLLPSRSDGLATLVALSGARRDLPGKNIGLRRATAGSTSPGPWSRELRDPLLARPARHRLVSSSCSSARSFASRFLHAGLTVRRSAVRFAYCDRSREDFHLLVDAHAGRTKNR